MSNDFGVIEEVLAGDLSEDLICQALTLTRKDFDAAKSSGVLSIDELAKNWNL